MRTLLSVAVVLLFLPDGDFGVSRLGSAETSDLVAPIALLVALTTGSAWNPRRDLRAQAVLWLTFCAWALVAAGTVNLRYGYETDYWQEVALVRWAKMVLYVFLGLVVARRFAGARQRIVTTLAVAGAVWATGVLLFAQVSEAGPPGGLTLDGLVRGSGFEAANAVSVGLSGLGAFLVATLSVFRQDWRTRVVVLGSLAVIVPGLLLSGGRGGVLAFLVALVWVAVSRGVRAWVVAAALASLLFAGALYTSHEPFGELVDRTLQPDERKMERYGAGVAGIDDGARVGIWQHEGSKLIRAPIWGTGLGHRGAVTGLWSTGSHNHFLQMFLETGIIGGLLFLLPWVEGWFASVNTRRRTGNDRALAYQAMLVAFFVGALGGEYFYGGPNLFLLVFARAWVVESPTAARFQVTHDISRPFERPFRRATRT